MISSTFLLLVGLLAPGLSLPLLPGQQDTGECSSPATRQVLGSDPFSLLGPTAYLYYDKYEGGQVAGAVTWLFYLQMWAAPHLVVHSLSTHEM